MSLSSNVFHIRSKSLKLNFKNLSCSWNGDRDQIFFFFCSILFGVVSPHMPHPESTRGHWMVWWVRKLCESYAVAFPVTGSQPRYSFRHLKNQCWDALKLFSWHVVPQGLITTPFAWSIILFRFSKNFNWNTEMKTVLLKNMPWFVFFLWW